ncbi:hypothetical protein PUR_38040 [Paenibacillus sp. URB8-2]|nr:hypothetical protein PUR_38040 [Paenibacillus sp. URB8-2]
MLRGDKSLDAALEYMSLMRVINEVHQCLEDMYESVAKERLKIQYNEKFKNPDSKTSNQDRESLSNRITIDI